MLMTVTFRGVWVSDGKISSWEDISLVIGKSERYSQIKAERKSNHQWDHY